MSLRFLTIWMVLWIAVMQSPHVSAQIEFVDRSDERGILESFIDFGFGGGVAAADYDNDGDVDLYLPQRLNSPDRLYRNDGNGQFTDVAARTGIDIELAGRNALWFDYNNDQLQDLLITADCFNSPDIDCIEGTTLRLYEQQPSGAFVDVTAEAGLDNAETSEFFGHRAGVCCGDIDRDGDLDLVIGQWEGELELYMNNDGVFVDEAEKRGVVNPNAPFANNYWQSVLEDFNGDGWLDIFCAVDFFENQLWINNRDGTFVNVAAQSGVDFSFNDMGIAVGDYVNDGDFDVYVTNIFEDDKHSLLLRNESTVDNVAFDEVSESLGVDDTSFGWGVTWLDANNDTYLDLAVTNGWFNGIGFDDQSRFFMGSATVPGTFEEITSTAGFDDQLYGSCLISLDFDRDGDLDMAQVCNPSTFEGPFRILENQLAQTENTNWLVVRPRQAGPNHWCIGAIVSVEFGDDSRLIRRIAAGTSIHGQEPAEAFFGLGAGTVVDRVEVRWPMGDSTVWENVAAGQVFDAHDADLDLDGAVSLLDVFALVQDIGPCTNACQADFNDDGVVDNDDIQLFIDALL